MTTESYEFPKFITGSKPLTNSSITIASGENLVAFVPLGQVKVSGEYKEWAPAANDGTESAVAMTAFPVDASAAAVEHAAIDGGCFNPEGVAWPVGTTDAQKKTAFTGTTISLQLPG